MKKESEKEIKIKSYFEREVNPIFSDLIAELILHRPENIRGYSIKWLRERFNRPSQREDEIIPDEEFTAMRRKKLEKKLKQNRLGISSQVQGQSYKRAGFQYPEKNFKDGKVKSRILSSFRNNVLFNHLNEEEIQEMICLMREMKTGIDQVIFQNGKCNNCVNCQKTGEEEKNCLSGIYFVASGLFERSQITEKGVEANKYYHPGEMFGDIFLLYHTLSFGNIISRSEGLLYSLNRNDFRRASNLNITKKREVYTNTLQNCYFFSKFNKQELEKICDLLVEVVVQEGEIVIHEGDTGEKFYIVIKGILVAYKGEGSVIQCCYSDKKVFGELSLTKKIPRQATVKSLTKSTLVYLTQDIFERVFEKEKAAIQKQAEERYNSKKMSYINRKRKQ